MALSDSSISMARVVLVFLLFCSVLHSHVKASTTGLPASQSIEIIPRTTLELASHPVAPEVHCPPSVATKGMLRRPLQFAAGALRSYNMALEERYFFLSFWQGGLLALLGDFVVQISEAGPIDVFRMLHITFLGFLFDGVVAAWYYEILDRVDPRRTFLSVAWKTAVGTVAFGPVVNGLFLAGVQVLGRTWDPRSFARALAAVTVTDVRVWPAVDILSFAVLPKVWRPLAASAMCLFFNAHISVEAHVDAENPVHAMPWPALGNFLEQIFLRMFRLVPR